MELQPIQKEQEPKKNFFKKILEAEDISNFNDFVNKEGLQEDFLKLLEEHIKKHPWT